MNIKKYIPALEWLPNYQKKWLKGDLSAGLTVGVMLIPQGMAYAMIAGLPPVYGLYAVTIPLLIYGLLGTSRQLAVGPVAMVSLLTAAGIGAIAEGGTETYILLAITLSLIVGLLQFFLGVFKLGFLVNFLSHPVISGFTSAAALIIGLSQLKHLLGIDIPRSHHVHEIIINAVKQFDLINWVTVGIGIGGIVLIKAIKNINKAIPSQLAAVVFGIVVVWSFGLTEHAVKIVGAVPDGLPSFSAPSFDITQWQALLPIALTIALVGFMESIAVAKAIQAKHKDYKIIPNQELIALGAANIGGAFFQSYPVTGGFSRTAVNDQAGAKSGMASIISAALVVLTLLFLTPLFYYLPKAILASVIMVAVFGLIDIKEAKHLWTSNKTDFWMLVITFIATLSLGIEKGIMAGVVLSLLAVIYQTTKPHVAILGKIPDTDYYRNTERFSTIREPKNLLVLRFDAQLYFANTTFVKETIENHIARRGNTLEGLVIDAGGTNNLDSSGAHLLEDILEECKAKDLKLYFAGVKGPVRDALERSHLTEKIGAENFFMSVNEAVNAHEKNHIESHKHSLSTYTSQTNIKH